MKQTNTITKKMLVADLHLNTFLKKYGVKKLSDFEVKQLVKFNLPPDQVIGTQDGSVLYNWEAVEYAKKAGLKEIDVVVIEGLDEDEVIQVVSLKNIHRKLSRHLLAELIIELRRYMDENPMGQHWKDEVPGKDVVSKIGFLLDYSYGMTSQILKIYKYNPSLLKKIDEGEMTFTQALNFCLPPKQSTAPEKQTLEEDEEDVPAEMSVEEQQDNVDETGNDNLDNKEKTTTEPEHPQQWRVAGEKHTVPCEPIAEIIIRYPSGKEVTVNMNDNEVEGMFNGKKTSPLQYSGGKFHAKDNSEFHFITTPGDKAGLSVIFWNSNGLAA